MIEKILQKGIEHPKTIGVIACFIGLALILFSSWGKDDDGDDGGMFI